MTDKKVTMKIIADEIHALMERLSMMGYHSVFSLGANIYERCESLSIHVDPKEYADAIRNYTLINIKKGGEANETN